MWRDRLAELPSAEPAIRDRDAKLLAWLEYSELLADGMWILFYQIKMSHQLLNQFSDFVCLHYRGIRNIKLPWKRVKSDFSTPGESLGGNGKVGRTPLVRGRIRAFIPLKGLQLP